MRVARQPLSDMEGYMLAFLVIGNCGADNWSRVAGLVLCVLFFVIAMLDNRAAR